MNNYKEAITLALEALKLGDLEAVMHIRCDINHEVLRLLHSPFMMEDDIEELRNLILIGNITYNNTDRDLLPIEDGIYDLLVALLNRVYGNSPVGAVPVDFKPNNVIIEQKEKEFTSPISYYSDDDVNTFNNMLFQEIITAHKKITIADAYTPQVYENAEYISKRLRTTQSEHPELVGTLDKCKYVLNTQARERGVFDDENVTIVERDFFRPLLDSGYMDPNEEYEMLASLKYDGVSIEADVTDHVISARTRGDTDQSITTDISPIFAGYKFPNAPKIEKPIGMKFEAIITYDNLARLNQLKGTNYINGRTAIIGLMGSSDAYKYREFVTLIPLQTDIKDDMGNRIGRRIEVAFLNRYYCRNEIFRHTHIRGTYLNLLYQIKEYTQEAEFARPFLNFMYDGVVFEFTGVEMIEKLGRVNSVNKYAIAVKFNALKKQTVFTGYTYTIGQNGQITPMIHYQPVEFLGSIHTKSTGSSLARFQKLNLGIGDIIDVEYTNDVMPYVTKPDNTFNTENMMRTAREKFPTHCPFCGSKLEISSSGKSVRCVNIHCKGRRLQMAANMISKLNLKDFAESAIEDLEIYSFKELMEAPAERFAILGPTNMYKLKNQLDLLKTTMIPDYQFVGALGFTGIASKTWKLIFKELTLKKLIELYNTDPQVLINVLVNIRGIGTVTAETIVDEMEVFKEDIEYITTLNVVDTKYLNQNEDKIRFTGFRNHDLAEQLRAAGYDVDENAGVTKDTKYLIVPYDGYTQGSKYSKAMKYGVTVISAEKALELLN